MKRLNPFLGGVLIISLGLNAYLWATASREAKRPSLAPRTKRSDIVQPPVGMPDLKLPPTPAPVPSAYATEDRADLESRLVEVESRINELLHPSERYPLLPRSPEVEERVRPYLDRVFKLSAREKPEYTVECHGRVCKVDSPQDYDKWMTDLQETFPGREMFRSMEFGRDGTFIELNDDSTIGPQVTTGILMSAHEELDRCGLTKASGTLSISFTFDTSVRAIRVSVGGSLEHDPVAECVRKALENAIARGYVSPNLTVLPADPIVLTLPLHGNDH